MVTMLTGAHLDDDARVNVCFWVDDWVAREMPYYFLPHSFSLLIAAAALYPFYAP